MAQFGWCSLKSSRRLSTHIHLQTNKINSIFPNILPLFQSGCRSQQTNSALIYRVARSKRHPSDGSSHCNVLEAKTQYSSGTSLRCPLDIFAPALPPFPASRYAELVSGGHLPTIAVRGRTAPSLYVFLASLELSFWLATLPLGCIACSRRSGVILLSIISGRKNFSFIKKQSFFKLFSIVISIFALKQSYFCETLKI